VFRVEQGLEGLVQSRDNQDAETRSPQFLLPQGFDDIREHHRRQGGWAISLDWLPVTTNQKLLKVPDEIRLTNWRPVHTAWVSDPLHRIRTGSLEEGEDRVLVVTIHIPLHGEREVGNEPASGPHVLDPVQDLGVLGGLLETKVVAREPNDHKVRAVHLLD